MNPLQQMAASLIAKSASAWAEEGAPIAKGLSRTERIRQLLKTASRPVSAAEIAFDMGEDFPNFGSHLVWLLLKYDLKKGRVLLIDGKYSWNRAYDEVEAKAIHSAVQLLRKHGFKVKEPAL